MIDKMRIALNLQLVTTALFGNSPYRDGKFTGYQSWRSHIWEDTDPDRCGTIPWVFDKDFGFEKYANYAMDVPMYFVQRNNKYLDCTGTSLILFVVYNMPAMTLMCACVLYKGIFSI